MASAASPNKRAPNTGPITADVDAQDRMTRYGTCVYAYGANGERAQKTDTATGHITAYLRRPPAFSSGAVWNPALL